MPTSQERIESALSIALSYGGIDGGHHKMWVIDQMVRALTGCPVNVKKGEREDGTEWSFETFGKSAEYRAWVKAAKAGDDGPNTYSWDEGIAP